MDCIPVAVEWIPGINDVRQRASHSIEEFHICGTTVGEKQLDKIHKGLTGGNRQRVFEDGREFIKNVCNDLCIGEAVIAEALLIFSVVREEHGRWRGSRRIGILIACVSIACQQLSIGVTDDAILKLQRVKQPSKTMNAQKKYVIMMLHNSGIVVYQAKAETYCLRICHNLGFNKDLSKMVSSQAKRISRMEHLNAKSCNMIVAVSVLFLIEKHNLSIQIERLCTMVNITRPTLIKWYAEAAMRSISYTRHFIQTIDKNT
jgi:transcription initiation factor TFIIIB Brf1 subunit/transcription initiation factor TFIIB